MFKHGNTNIVYCEPNSHLELILSCKGNHHVHYASITLFVLARKIRVIVIEKLVYVSADEDLQALHVNHVSRKMFFTGTLQLYQCILCYHQFQLTFELFI